jgi:hypothetical protein
MIARKTALPLLCLLMAAFAAPPTGQAQGVAGSWSMHPADRPEKVQATFVYGHSTQSHDWSPSAFKGLQLAPAERHDVHFSLERDAGRIEGDGSSSGETAAGSFRFSPEPGYTAELRKLGLGEIRPEEQISFALHDVSLAFARDMLGLGLANLTADKLLALRIHDAEPAYVKELRAAGAHVAGADDLIAFRIHTVSPALVTALRRMGEEPEDSQVLALTIHGATPDWLTQFDKLGYGGKTVTPDQLIAFRIHGVTPDYVAAVEKLGYDKPAPDQLIAMKIHGVTPDYISSVRSKGVKEPTLNQLVAMKIQGID